MANSVYFEYDNSEKIFARLALSKYLNIIINGVIKQQIYLSQIHFSQMIHYKQEVNTTNSELMFNMK